MDEVFKLKDWHWDFVQIWEQGYLSKRVGWHTIVPPQASLGCEKLEVLPGESMDLIRCRRRL